ncbi:MAG: hypothetical protein Q4G06_05395 [Clostridia bacterium]|nr:hypothetical protein [Clostridia bacterium]
MRLTAEVRIDAQELARKLRSDALWLHAAQEWHRLYEPYVPRNTGRLYADVRISPGQIEHMAPYAAYVYGGSFPANSGGAASRAWDRAAEPTQKPKLIAAIQAYVDSGGLKLGG